MKDVVVALLAYSGALITGGAFALMVFSPRALNSPHMRRIYWLGAAGMIVLVGFAAFTLHGIGDLR